MIYRPRKRVTLAALPMLSLLIASCATNSPPLPVVPEPIRIPSPPVVQTPAPSGTYWELHCKLMRYAADTLKRKLQLPELCSTLGQQ